MFVGLHESLELKVQVSVLRLQHVAVGLKGVNFRLDIAISIEQVVVGESKVISLLSCNHQLIICISKSIFSLEHLTVQLSVSSVLILTLSLEVSLLSQLSVKISLERLSLNHKSGVLIFSSGELSEGLIKSLVSSSKLVILLVSELSELNCFLLSLINVIINALEFGVVVLALSLFNGNRVSESVNFILIFSLLLSKFSEFILEVVGILS